MNKNMNLSWIDEKLNQMSLEEKVGQLLMVFLQDIKNEEKHLEIIDSVIKYNLGGVFHSSISRHILAKFVLEVQNRSKIPVFISGDYECGPGWVVEDGLRISRSMARGNAGDIELEYKIGSIIADQGRAIGTTVNFSPVIDLNTNNLNPDVNVRAYGEDVDTVCTLAVPFIKGIQENGMLACVKHFPGNGATNMDQHICTAIIECSEDEMKDTFLKAYKRCFEEANPAFVMVGHLEVPSLVNEVNPKNGRLVPSSVSKEIVTGLLKNELGFEGVAITDALNMGGITTHYTREEAAVKAIQAGIDMLLVFHYDYDREYEAIIKAVREGQIHIERIDNAVRNILIAKLKAGLDQNKGLPAAYQVIEELFANKEYEHISLKSIQNGITVLRNKNNALPIKDINGKRIAVISTFNPDKETLKVQKQEEITMIDYTPRFLEDRGAIVEHFEISLHMLIDDINSIVAKADQFDYIFYNFYIAPSWGIGTLIPNKSALRLFMFGLLSIEKPIIITAFGDPYIMNYCPNAKAYMCTFDETLVAQKAAVKAWLGEEPVRGKTPVTLANIFSRGDGINVG